MVRHARYFLLATAAVALFAIARHDFANMRALTTDTSFFTSQLAEVTRLEKEMLQFQVDANTYVLGHGSTGKEQVQLSFDLLWSRLNTQWTKFVNPRIDALRNYKQAMGDFAGALKNIDADVAGLQPGDLSKLQRINAAIRRSAPVMSTMNQDAYAELVGRSVDLAVNQQGMARSMDRFQWLFMIICFAGFTVLLIQLRRSEKLYADLQKREAEIRLLATVDALTGLNNRRHFDERMRSIDEGHWPGEIQLLLIDLDGFKQINDTHGHEAGDCVLREVSQRIRDVSPQSAVLARIGGDEFGIAFAGAQQQARQTAAQIIEAVRQGIIYSSAALKVGASIGITSRKPATKSAVMMLREADRALYAAKDNGRNRYSVFSEDTGLPGDCVSTA